MLRLLILIAATQAQAGNKSWYDEKLTPAQLTEMKNVFTPLRETREYVTNSLPPCEGLDQLSNAAFKHEPPEKLCPKAYAGYDKMQRYDRHLRDSCRSLVSWAEKKLRDERVAHSQEIYKKAKSELRALRIAATGDFDSTDPIDVSSEYNGEVSEDFDEKQSDDLRCYIAISITLQYRKDSLTLMQHHFQKVEQALDELPDHPAADAYFEYLRYGNAPAR